MYPNGRRTEHIRIVFEHPFLRLAPKSRQSRSRARCRPPSHQRDSTTSLTNCMTNQPRSRPAASFPYHVFREHEDTPSPTSNSMPGNPTLKRGRRLFRILPPLPLTTRVPSSLTRPQSLLRRHRCGWVGSFLPQRHALAVDAPGSGLPRPTLWIVARRQVAQHGHCPLRGFRPHLFFPPS